MFVQRVVVIFDSCCLLFVSADRSVSKSPYEGRINMYTWDGDIESNGAAAPRDAQGGFTWEDTGAMCK